MRRSVLFSCSISLWKKLTQKAAEQRCYATASSSHLNPYPFPSSPEPTPYQIFHLLPDASPADVKHRYYELVRIYHPDSAESRRYEPDPARRHARFSAITRAYTSLQKQPNGDNVDPEATSGFSNPWRRAPHAQRRRYEEPRFVDDRWKDRLIWGGLCFALVSVVAQTTMVWQRRTQVVAEHVWDTNSAAFTVPESSRLRKEADDDTLRLRGHRG
ncbi:hypothetical protein M0805_006379 [Coniferiporia weirii]|nr:hypothetical protein M0805_006379 [Coniferiporia weirii]